MNGTQHRDRRLTPCTWPARCGPRCCGDRGHLGLCSTGGALTPPETASARQNSCRGPAGSPRDTDRAPARCDERSDLTSNELLLDLPTFADLPLRPELLAVVDELGYTQPSPIQAQSIAPLVEGRDLLGQAATGTGKTAAFALPMLERLAELRPDRGRGDAPFGLILAPTRELALQVSEAVTRYGAGLRRPRRHRLRRGARRPAVEGAAERRRRRGGHPGPGHRPDEPGCAAPRRARDRRARRGRRDARHGLRRGHRDAAGRHSRHPPGRAVQRDHPAPHRDAGAEVPARAGDRADPARGRGRGRGAARCARPPTWCRARTPPRRWAGCWRPSGRPRPSCSAAPASTSTRSPRR